MGSYGDKLLYSPEESAELLGVGRSQMFELIGRGEVESVKIGRLRKSPRRDRRLRRTPARRGRKHHSRVRRRRAAPAKDAARNQPSPDPPIGGHL